MKSWFRARTVGDPRPTISDPKQALRRWVAGLLGLAALALSVSNAAAHDVTIEIACDGVTFNASNFPDGTVNTIQETITLDGAQVVATDFNFNGSAASNTIPLNIPSGTHSVSAHADFSSSDGFTGSSDASEDLSCGGSSLCTAPGSINSNFNGTAVVGVGTGPAFIWFNSNLSTKGMTAGKSIFLTDSKVFINGVGHDVPDAKITFAAVSCATTVFDDGTNTWITTVPVAGSDEIFLSGLAFPVTSLPGGAKVTWEGNFATDQPGACLSWKWGAAAYKSFTTLSSNPLVIDYNAAKIKATHQAACGVNNGDHAGTPENATIRASVTGGARGGGGSNFTGSWSGTGSVCPVCPPSNSVAAATALRPVVQEMNSTPVKEISLAAPRPNPTTGPVTFGLALPRAAAMSLDVYDVSGRKIREVANGAFSAGVYSLRWDLLDRGGHPVSRGIYFVRLAVEGRVWSRTLVIDR